MKFVRILWGDMRQLGKFLRKEKEGGERVVLPEIELNLQEMEYTVHLESERKGRRDLKRLAKSRERTFICNIQPDSSHLKA